VYILRYWYILSRQQNQREKVIVLVMSATGGPYESKSSEEEKIIQGHGSLEGGSVIKSAHSKGPSDGGSPDENNKEGTSDVKFETTIDRKGVTLKDLPQFGGQDAVAYGNVTMPAKLYGVKGTIQSFVESKLVDDWNITKLWTGWLKQVDLNTVISKKQVRLQVSEELKPQMETVGNSGQPQISFSTANAIFADHDGREKKRMTFSAAVTGCFFICLLVPMISSSPAQI